MSAFRRHRGCGIAAGFVLLALMGCGRPDPAQRPQRPAEVLDFDKLFAQNCSGCHGRDGNRGPAPPLNDPLFLAIVADTGDIDMAIDGGRPGTLMPAFSRKSGGPLTAKQVEALANGIRNKWPRESSGGSLPDYSSEDSGDAKAGREVFNQTCARCHGENGKGGAKAGALNDPDFLALISNQVLRRITICGRTDLPGGCPDYRHQREGASARPLTGKEITDIVALLASWRHGPDPAGQ